MSMALFSPLLPPSHLPILSTTFSCKTHCTQKPYISLLSKRNLLLLSTKATDDGAGKVGSAVIGEEEKKVEKNEEASPTDSGKKVEKLETSLGSNGAVVLKFKDPRWVEGTWDLKQFEKDGKTNWDSVIDAVRN